MSLPHEGAGSMAERMERLNKAEGFDDDNDLSTEGEGQSALSRKRRSPKPGGPAGPTGNPSGAPYPTEMPQIRIAEYGRYLQQMVEYAATLPTRDERSEAVAQIMRTVGILMPSTRDNPEQRRKVWDHLHAISGFTLACDGPFDEPTQESVVLRPERVPYGLGPARKRHYGRLIQLATQAAATLPQGEERDLTTNYLAGFMRMQAKNNRGQILAEDQMALDLRELSEAELIATRPIDLEQGPSKHPRQAPIGKPEKQYGKYGGGSYGGGFGNNPGAGSFGSEKTYEKPTFGGDRPYAKKDGNDFKGSKFRKRRY